MKKPMDRARVRSLLKWVSRFKGVPMLVLGDVMVDRSLRGPVHRISPEAPVPVIEVEDVVQTPGGAGNVACNLAALGARPTLLSIRGDDSEGETLSRILEDRGVHLSGMLITPDRPTITKTRIMAGHQQVARLDVEKRVPLSQRHTAQIMKSLVERTPGNKGIIISDYGKGIVTPPVIRAAIKEAHRHQVTVTVDPKIEHFMSYKNVDCITPNTQEASQGFRVLPPKNEEALVQLGWKIVKKLRCECLIITRGEKGMTLFHKKGWLRHIPTYAQEVFDVTGAGDTVVATFSLARAVGAPYEEAAQLANAAASLVVAKVGTSVATQEELMERLKGLAKP